MGFLGMTKEEYDYSVDNYTEAFAALGQDAKLYQVRVDSKDFYDDSSLTHRPFVNIGLIFENDPKPILKKLNWLTEDEELPYVCYMVAQDKSGALISISENMLVLIPSVYGLITEEKFLVVNVRGSSINPLVWICKLVPYRAKIDMIPETRAYDAVLAPQTDVGFAHLKR